MSCKKATLLVEKSKLTPLSLKEFLTMKMHLAICSGCTKYNKLSQQLDELFEQLSEQNVKTMYLSNQKKEEILKLIEG